MKRNKILKKIDMHVHAAPLRDSCLRAEGINQYPTADELREIYDEMGLPRLEKALQDFPNLIFLGHSQRFWSEIGSDVTEENRSGYPTGPVMPGGRVVELMRKYPNLYGDMSAGSGGNAFMRDPEHAYRMIEEFQDRLCFGTDIASYKKRPMPNCVYFWMMLCNPEKYPMRLTIKFAEVMRSGF